MKTKLVALLLVVFGMNMQAQNDSINNILTKAKQGDAVAQNEVGMWYYTGKNNVKQDYKVALQWWAHAAQQKNVAAIGNMALCYQYGRGIEKDSLMALQLYMRSIEAGNKALLKERMAYAEKGDVYNNVLMALCFQKGAGVEKNVVKAANYFKTAAGKGSADAQRELALLLEVKIPQQAALLYKKAAEQGDVVSLYRYGRLLLSGKGVEQNKQQAVSYWLKAAEQGYAQAQCDLGNLYYQGTEVAKDAQQAAKWFTLSALQGFAHAEWNLAVCFMRGEGVERNFDQAIYWFGEAVADGYAKNFQTLCKDAEKGWKGQLFGTYLQGMAYYAGTNRNFEKAVESFKQCDKKGIAEAQTMEALCYANKEWEKGNLKKGVKMLMKASETLSNAAYYLGLLYEVGRGVEKDMDKAVALFKQAASGGNALAQSYLGNLYYEGKGVTQDYGLAVNYFRMVDEQGRLSAVACANYAACLENGLGGLAVDKKKARALQKKDKKNNMAALLKLVPLQ